MLAPATGHADHQPDSGRDGTVVLAANRNRRKVGHAHASVTVGPVW